jgi:hypothetical protein
MSGADDTTALDRRDKRLIRRNPREGRGVTARSEGRTRGAAGRRETPALDAFRSISRANGGTQDGDQPIAHARVPRSEGCGSFSLIPGIRHDGALICGCEHGTSPRCGLWIGPVSSVSKSPESYRTRERDLAVSAAAIMTRTAATAIAMSHRTQSMPGLPLPPNAV